MLYIKVQLINYTCIFLVNITFTIIKEYEEWGPQK
jgi:hypothetical protein